MHVVLNTKYNELFVENIALKEQIKMKAGDSSGGIRLEELEKINREMQRVKDETVSNYFKIRKDSILRISNKIIDKLDEVHSSYSLTSNLLSQLDEFVLFFQPIRATWLPKGETMKEAMLEVKNVAQPPQIVGVTWKNYNLMNKELPNIEEERKELMGMIDSF